MAIMEVGPYGFRSVASPPGLRLMQRAVGVFVDLRDRAPQGKMWALEVVQKGSSREAKRRSDLANTLEDKEIASVPRSTGIPRNDKTGIFRQALCSPIITISYITSGLAGDVSLI